MAPRLRAPLNPWQGRAAGVCRQASEDVREPRGRTDVRQRMAIDRKLNSCAAFGERAQTDREPEEEKGMAERKLRHRSSYRLRGVTTRTGVPKASNTEP